MRMENGVLRGNRAGVKQCVDGVCVCVLVCFVVASAQCMCQCLCAFKIKYVYRVHSAAPRVPDTGTAPPPHTICDLQHIRGPRGGWAQSGGNWKI